jgi:hypothetical protein
MWEWLSWGPCSRDLLVEFSAALMYQMLLLLAEQRRVQE